MKSVCTAGVVHILVANGFAEEVCVNTPFSRAEYAHRLAEVKSRMDKAGFDLIVCQDPANMCWLTGFDGWSFYVPQCVLVHRDEETPIWFGRAQDAKSAHFTTYLPAHNIVPFSEKRDAKGSAYDFK